MKPIQQNTNQNANENANVQRKPTQNEKDIAKFEKKFSDLNRIDAKDAGVNYFFPLLRALAAEAAEQEQQIERVAEVVESLEESVEEIEAQIAAGSLDGAAIATLEDARDVILKLGSLLDKTMVASGFYSVEPNVGLKDTGKAPPELRAEYSAIGPEVAEVVTAIQEAITAYGADDDDAGNDGDDNDDDDDDDVNTNVAKDIANAAIEAAQIAPPNGTTPNDAAKNGANDAA